MDMRKISYFVEVVKAKSFSGAAQNLYVSQPMLSKAINQLETELGVKLIDRANRRFQVTDFGRIFYERSVRLLDEYNELGNLFDGGTGAVNGAVAISIPSVILTLYFPQFLSDFQQKYPDIRIDLFEEGSYAVLNSVLNDVVDLGVVMMPVCAQGVEIHPIIEDRCVLVTGREHPLANRPEVEISRLEHENFIIFNNRFVLNDMIQQSCHSAGFSPHIIYQSSLDSFIFRMVSLNQGISILPRPLVLASNQHISFAELNPPIPWRLALIVRKNKYQSLAAQKMLQSILFFFQQ